MPYILMNKEKNTLEIVTFLLGQETLGIDITLVKEVIHIPDITYVPKAHHSIEGVINLRGTVLPIINLHKHFNIESKNDPAKARIIILEIDDLVGLIVDSILEVCTVNLDCIEPIPPFYLDQNKNRYVTGVTKLNDKFISLLDIKQIFSSDFLTSNK